MAISTGTINAVIDTFKPTDFFKKGGIITIVYNDDVVATIHVSLNDVDDDSKKQSLVRNNSRYVIDGDAVSLRRLDRLCNLDITNKGDYLRFNGSPAVIPDDFAVGESGDSFFVTPKRDKSAFTLGRQNFRRFNDFDDMLTALSKEDDSGLSYSEPDVKTVYILVSMHGEDKKNKLIKTIQNTVHILPSGLCSAPLESPSEQLIRLEQFRVIPPVLMEKAYEKESLFRIDNLKKNVKLSLETQTKSEPLTRGLTIGQVPKRIAQYGELEKLHVGPLTEDREYSDDSEVVIFTQCISILGSNWKSAQMMAPYGRFKADKTLSDAINIFYAPFSKKIVTQDEAEDQFQKFQSLNLLNVEVLNGLTTAMNGIDIPFKPFTGMINGETDRLKISRQGTGIPHYTNVRLSHLLDLFQKLGFEKVVIFDEGCRTGDMYNTSMRAADERAAAEGGRRTKRRRTRRRSRKSHKKS